MSRSGLGTVKRDWVEDGSSQPSSQKIEWEATPPPRALTGAEQRLKDIQDALNGFEVASEKRKPPVIPSGNAGRNYPPPNASSSSGAINKRTSTTAGFQEPPAKKRTIPWEQSTSRGGIVPAPSGSRTTARSSVPVPAPTAPKTRVAGTKTSSNKPLKPAAVFLSGEQTQILKLVAAGDSVFYTGSAGTGKSVLLREIIKSLRKKHSKSPDAIAITASTGIAACNIGGVTIHSFAGIGLGIEPADELATKIRKNKKASTRWARTKVLIIDEVSMVDGDLFDKLCLIGGKLRKSTLPFGGIQVIVTGDFFQLPPVTKSGNTKFAFEANMWKETIKRTFNLTKVFRQKDQDFVDMLNEMRFGRLTDESVRRFKSLNREIHYEDGLGATELFPRREDVERSNATRMSRLSTQSMSFRASDGGTVTDITQRDKMLANFMMPKQLDLRVDAQVMLIKNVDESLVNGSMGRVLRFTDPRTWAQEEEASMPGGGGNITLSKPVSDAKGKGKAPSAGDMVKYPVVEFSVPGGTREMLVTPDVSKVELPNGEIQVSRSQLPLILAWAMSIHKSQGQTLERVKVDLGKVFEKGQAYVALSRATSMHGLQVLNFDRAKVQAHPKVVKWSETLETIDVD